MMAADPKATERAFRGFLFTVARWKSLDWFKRRERQPETYAGLALDDLSKVDTTASALDQIIGEEFVHAIMELIRSTAAGDEMRDVFLLRYMEGYSYREIAAIIADRTLSGEETVREAARLRQSCKRLKAIVRQRMKGQPYGTSKGMNHGL